MRLLVYTDGGSRGNPGLAAFGVVVCKEDGTVLHEYAKHLGVMTNNEAEYNGLLSGMSTAKEYGADDVVVTMDSELVVKQMRGEYRVKARNLRPLYEDASSISRTFARFEIRHVRRDHPSIQRADALLNAEMDRVGR